MGRRSISLLLAATLASLAACRGGASGGGAAEPTGGVDQAEYEILDRLEALGRAVDDAGGDCPRVTIALARWHADNHAPLPTLMVEARAGSNLVEAELAKVEERVEEILTDVVDAVDGCQGDEGTRTAWSRVDALLQG